MSPPKPSTKAKIGELDMAICVDQDIIRLDVPVNEAHLVNTVHGTNKLADIEPKMEKYLTCAKNNNELRIIQKLKMFSL